MAGLCRRNKELRAVFGVLLHGQTVNVDLFRKDASQDLGDQSDRDRSA